MKAVVLRGSRQEIADGLARIEGDVREAIVLVAEAPAGPVEPTNPPLPGEDIFAEMEPYMVRVGDADYSREAIYTRMDGE